MQKITKAYKTISIFISEEDFDLVKKVNACAKKDIGIDKKDVKSRKNLVSLVTRMLWKNYISKFEDDADENVDDVEREVVDDETINTDNQAEDESSDEISDSKSVEEWLENDWKIRIHGYYSNV